MTAAATTGGGGQSSMGGRKRNLSSSSLSSSRHRKKLLDLSERNNNNNDDEIESSSSDDEQEEDDDIKQSSNNKEDDEDETVEEKRIRMARAYLKRMEEEQQQESSEDEESDDEEDRLGQRLQKKRLEYMGQWNKPLANELQKSMKQLWIQSQSQETQNQTQKTHQQQNQQTTRKSKVELEMKQWIDSNLITLCHGRHDSTVTSVAFPNSSSLSNSSSNENNSIAYSGSKDGIIMTWDISRQQSIHSFSISSSSSTSKRKRRCDLEILSLSASDDGHYLSVGLRDSSVQIYDVRTSSLSSSTKQPVMTFFGHKGPVQSVCFRSGTLQLFSASADRCLRHYDLNEMTHIETLYGHQGPISNISCCHHHPITVGRDRTIRVWKVQEQTHLIYRPLAKRTSSADCVSVVNDGSGNENYFVSGHDNGDLSLWRMNGGGKRAIDTIIASHGYYHDNGNDGNDSGSGYKLGRSIGCCDVLSDVIATGSNDGYLRLWKIAMGGHDEKEDNDNDNEHQHQNQHHSKQKEEQNQTYLKSINKIPIHGYINDIALSSSKVCIAAIGQEPRLGRWDRIPRAKNRLAIIPFHSSSFSSSGIVDDDDEDDEDDDSGLEEDVEDDEDDSEEQDDDDDDEDEDNDENEDDENEDS